MDPTMSLHVRDAKRLEELADAIGNGVVLLNAEGKVVWLDRALRRRLNGGLEALAIPMIHRKSGAIDCLAAPVELKVNGAPVTVCAMQQTDEPNASNELLATIESLMADGTSWFSNVVERLKAMRQVSKGTPEKEELATGLDLLSSREREVLGLICEGKSDVDMGELLGLSENTVRNHIASLYRKIGVNRRTGAIIWARERGIRSRADALSRPRRHNGNGNGRSPAAY
jgi:DNA-binding CsgD family transcriptional regulator